MRAVMSNGRVHVDPFGAGKNRSRTRTDCREGEKRRGRLGGKSSVSLAHGDRLQPPRPLLITAGAMRHAGKDPSVLSAH